MTTPVVKKIARPSKHVNRVTAHTRGIGRPVTPVASAPQSAKHRRGTHAPHISMFELTGALSYGWSHPKTTLDELRVKWPNVFGKKRRATLHAS